MTKLLIASGNPGKLREFQEIFAGEAFELLLPQSLGIQLDVVEDGSSYAENAAKKALAYGKASGMLTLADDSGLEVDVLGGAPGLHSARYSPLPEANDADRRRHLLTNLQGRPKPWRAHFHCTVAIFAPGEELRFAVGNCPGEIIDEERGTNGFGYDPIFLLDNGRFTMAELSSEAKNEISHRALAVKAALPVLRQYLD